MSESVNPTVSQDEENPTVANIITNDLFGRRTIFSSVEELNEDNIIDEINSAIVIHLENLLEEERLYWYRRGLQPVLKRTKERNKFVLNKIIENHAEEIVSFKNGYLMTEPCAWIARNDESQEDVNTMNEYLYRSGKQDADNEVVDWFHTTGLGYIYVDPNDDEDSEDVPYRAYSMRPMQALVAYSMKPGNKPVYAANVVVDDHRMYLDVWTREWCFHLNGLYDPDKATDDPDRAVTAVQLLSKEPNVIGEIPIIEYRYNSTNMAAFEPVVSLCDNINAIRSDQTDGIDQFIQSLLVITNADLDEDETASTIKRKGMLLLTSTSELAAKVELISEQLDQTQTQQYVESILQNMFAICGMPNRAEGGRTYDTTGAAVMASFGWYQADAFARNTTDLFRKSNRQFEKIVLKILQRKGLVPNLKLSDFELHFVRNETANAQSKAQAFQQYMAGGMHPILAMSKSGASSDPVSDYEMSKDYIRLRWGSTDATPAVGSVNTEVVEGEDSSDNSMDGAV